MSTIPGDLPQVAKNAELNGDWLEALNIWDAIAVRTGSTDFWPAFFAARAASSLGRCDDALERLATATKVAHETVDRAACATLRAEIEERRGRDDEAVGWWQRAMELEANPYWALYGLGRSLLRLGRRSESQHALARALALPSAERNGALFAARLELQGGHFSNANAILQRFAFSKEETQDAILTAFPGMTSPAERFAMYKAASETTGSGHLVDLGCFLGSLSASMALGVSGNDRALQNGRKVHSFDAFRWERYMDSIWNPDLPFPLPRDGESFLPVFEHLVGAWRELIQVHTGDLTSVRWSAGPIELLSIDAMKSPSLSRVILSEFYPALTGDRPLVFHQDFCHGFTWWIHLHHFLLREHFRVVDRLDGSAGVLFELIRPIGHHDLSASVVADLSDAGLAADAFAHSMEIVAPADRGTIAAAQIRCELDNGRSEVAERLAAAWAHDPLTQRDLQAS